MKRTLLAFMATVSCAGALFALETDPEDAIYIAPDANFSTSGSTFTDRNGNPTNWVSGSYLIIKNYTGNKNFSYDYTVRGLRWDVTSGYRHLDQSGKFLIGSGGLTLVNSGAQMVLGRGSRVERIRLTADQTWSGPASGNYAHVGFADDNHVTAPYIYQYAYLNAASGVGSWTLRDNIAVWFGSTNTLADVDVRIENPARIRLYSVERSDGKTVYLDACLHAKSLTLAGDGVVWQSGGTIANYKGSGYPTLQPRMDSFSIAPLLVLEGGADMLLKSATWDIPTLRVTGSGATSTLKGDLTFLRASTDVVLADGATLELAATNRESGVSAAIAVTGVGTLRITPDVWELTGGLALGADVDLEIAGEGAIGLSVSGGKSLVLNPGVGRDLALTSLNIGYAGTVSVASGTVRFPSMAAFGETATFDVAADANVVFLSSSGFDASRLTGPGAANYTFDYLTVMDATVTEPSITVYTNEVLRILGNGLTAATAVTLAGGTMRFERTATVSSPVSVTSGSFIEAIDEAVTGTVAGAVTCANVDPTRRVSIPVKYGSPTKAGGDVGGIWALGPGTVVLAGGGTFAGDGDSLYVTRDARVHLAGGSYSFGSTSTATPPLVLAPINTTGGLPHTYGWGRHLCVRDGAIVTFAYGTGSYESKILVVGPKDGDNYDATPYNPVFEVAAGGTVTLPHNSRIALAQTDNNVHLKITGGVLNFDDQAAYIMVGSGQATASAELYLESGTLSLGSLIQRMNGFDGSGTNRFTRFRFFWSGGTLKLNRHFSSGYVFNMLSGLYSSPYWQASGVLRMSMQLTGQNCVLDLSEMPRSSVTNMPPKLDEAEWYGNGCLTVKGGKEFVMNSVPDGFSLRLEGEGTRVTIPEGAYVYDYATCLNYRNWNGNDRGRPYSVTNTALSALSMAGFTVAGTNCSFAVVRDMPVAVTNVTVAATGDWNSRTAVSTAGALTAENMTFENGSLLSIPYVNSQTMLFPLTGTLSLPASVNVRTAPGPLSGTAGQCVFAAAGGVFGSPAWNMLSGRPQVKSDEDAVWVVPFGVVIIIR